MTSFHSMKKKKNTIRKLSCKIDFQFTSTTASARQKEKNFLNSKSIFIKTRQKKRPEKNYQVHVTGQ